MITNKVHYFYKWIYKTVESINTQDLSRKGRRLKSCVSFF